MLMFRCYTRDDEPGVDAYTWRRSQFFWHHHAAMGLANAVADACRAHLAQSPRPSLWAQSSAIDPLLSQPPPGVAHSSALLSPPASPFFGVAC